MHQLRAEVGVRRLTGQRQGHKAPPDPWVEGLGFRVYRGPSAGAVRAPSTGKARKARTKSPHKNKYVGEGGEERGVGVGGGGGGGCRDNMASP